MPVMNKFAQQAKAEGELVYAYQQGDEGFHFHDIGPWADARNGYCGALALKWIARRLRDEDLPYDLQTRFAEAEDWRITRTHNMGFVMGGYDPMLNEFGLQWGSTKRLFQGGPSALKIVPVVDGTPSCYFISYKRKGGGHAAAVQHQGKIWRYFDANYGQFIFRSKDRFLNWYQGFLTDSGYAAKYTVQVYLLQTIWKTGGGVRALRARFGG